MPCFAGVTSVANDSHIEPTKNPGRPVEGPLKPFVRSDCTVDMRPAAAQCWMRDRSPARHPRYKIFVRAAITSSFPSAYLCIAGPIFIVGSRIETKPGECTVCQVAESPT